MVKSSSIFVYNLILAMVAWWMPVLESPTNLGQMRKKPKGLLSWLFGMHSSSMILEMSKHGLKLCWSVQSFLFSPVWCCFPNSKGTELFWVALILIFLYSLFSCFGGYKNLQSCKITCWMTFITFISNFPRDLNKHKVPREVKNKRYHHHSINK